MKWRRVAAGVAAGVCVFAGIVWIDNFRDGVDVSEARIAPATAEQVARGAYLARAGNCAACHTARGGQPYAGGRGIETPFGTVFASNLTPDATHGLGQWSPAQFWRALHHGRSRDGRLLYPAFPYTSTTLVTRADSDALLAYLQSLPPVAQATPPHTLRWPFSTQAALAVWRTLYFSPGAFQPDPAKPAAWNRGAYLVRGLGHCAACHSERNALGAMQDAPDLAGGLIPMQNWYAPSLALSAEAGVAHWPDAEVVRLLKTGIAAQGSATGPMAEVVLGSTQYLNDTDLTAMAAYLKTLATDAPAAPATRRPLPPPPPAQPPDAATAKLYEHHCADCHGARGEGIPGAYPALAGNRAVTMASPVNLVQIVLHGGFAPATQGNPRPFGMPPFMLVLNEHEIAALLTHIRTQWGNQAGAVSELDVLRVRADPRR
ncbi:MAG: alcohol dehydrogenase [Betaproteobacteria bacterium HGW-Betaproteobacteria-3]|jgi:mono/diheme cytochrome c family protein|nr:MAG: alcohol dehydrogenase [Betaproteobacteria bacterium HGW-Betaproteobacteria-3]